MRKSHYLLPLCGSVLAFTAAAQTSPPQMTARELFYAAAPADAKPAATPTKKKAPTRKPQERAQPESEVAATPPTPKPAASPAAQSAAPVINAAMRTSAPPPTSGTALGLKYTILKIDGSTKTPVASNTVFHTNDKIQFSIEANGPGYLYIVSRGSSGQWKPMFPSPEIEGGDNRIEGFHDYTFPNGYRYSFDDQAGEERLFLILSRDPKPDFEQLVYSLRDKTTTPASDTKPAAPQAAPPHKTLVAASIDDATIDRFRTVYARDLVIEKATDAPTSDTKEKASFVVNATGASDSCVVADLTLAHR